ncbi:tetraacyldisaccharide 4'-kinase [Notoacmeibacter sp. MSK16QG-6]|uniref:tetraacyldisaccharide 4'-kinase n=1 Tax=Notoacmeibacter sp. MSK16QG-6 TaxID=2957982 RepID=UPI00209DA844|nr:tetraacyldisaccharide 4'-kinase [Notoacmeibacter sp. MSK16QG-6]MCP1198496.1 tetraacyldisaccharide 4'-kinase [Notoacmeibacter sp. MSK16QG-6]
MASEAPPFWWIKGDWRGYAMAPAGWVYGAVAGYRQDRAPRRPVEVPVLCVGNFTVGGAGKTPVAIELARAAGRLGRKPGILSRGYGGNLDRPRLVDPDHDLARHVGDEPLLLARAAPVAVTPNRLAGARLLMEERQCDLLIMDDGFQSARIAIDHAMLVVDAHHGFGNGHIIPAGPLRAPLRTQLRHADSLLVMGEGDAADHVVRVAARAALPIHRARIIPKSSPDLSGKPCFAFAGIGVPEKFYITLEEMGAQLAMTRSFPDHHAFTEDDAAELLADAHRNGLPLVTTEKDAIRLRGGKGALQTLYDESIVLPVDAKFDNPTAAARIIEATIDAYKRRRLADGNRT